MAELHAKVPRLLWHYTTWSGLEGILRDHELWASQIRYLNDTLEAKYAERVFRTLLLRSCKTLGTRRLVAGEIDDLIYRIENSQEPIVTAAFSSESDSLGQWRGYGELISFAIGFDSEALTSLCTVGRHPNFLLASCTYSYLEYRERLHDLIVLAHRFLRLKMDWDLACLPLGAGEEDMRVALQSYESVNVVMTEVCDKFAERAPQVKHPAFREEREWRLIAKCVGRADELSFRRSASLVVPYVKFPLGSRSNSPIRRVIVGPCPHPFQFKEAIQLLTERYSLVLNVANSSVPFRNW
jgi:hypothetical protein